MHLTLTYVSRSAELVLQQLKELSVLNITQTYAMTITYHNTLTSVDETKQSHEIFVITSASTEDHMFSSKLSLAKN